MSDEWNEMLDAIKGDHEKAASGGSRKYWAPPTDKEGTFAIRILPPLKKLQEKKFYFDHKNHWVDGQSYECLNQTLVDKDRKLHEAEPCPICTMSKKFYKIADNDRNSEEWKLAGEISAKQRYTYRVIVRGSDDETTPKFYETGKTVFNLLYHILTETDYGIIVDPKNGRDFNITKVGTGRRSKYDQSLPAAKETPIFSDATKLKDCLTKAIEMSYGSLIEFQSAESLANIIKNYLDPESAKESLVKTNPTVATKATPSKVVEEEDNALDVVNDDEVEDDIDDILSDFSD